MLRGTVRSLINIGPQGCEEAVATTKGRKRADSELDLAGGLMMIQNFEVQ